MEKNPTYTAHQIVAIIDGQRKVVQTVADPAEAMTIAASFPFPARAMEIEVDFDPAAADHLN